MRSLTRAAYRLGVAVLVVAAVGCSSHGAPAPALQPLSDQERVAHVLSRLTFGARPGDADRVAAIGIDRWIDQQLRPEGIPDSALDVVLASLAPKPADFVSPEMVKYIQTTPIVALRKDTTARTRAAIAELNRRLANVATANDRFASSKVAHAQVGERQLLEVVTDFWENHFSLYYGKLPAADALVDWDARVIRPHALGKFRDLLGATAHSPAMLHYLDNRYSSKSRPNENYARELMELHTLGANGGYTQKDVEEVARALTGWSFAQSGDTLAFVFRDDWHDKGEKIVLGHTLPAGRGIEDGEEVLDILARHPATAHYIAFKLARRLVSDDPPPALVNRAAATFTRTDGNIADVVRTIVTGPEFFSRAAFRAKVKTPFELVVSTWRALDVPASGTPITANLITQLGQRTFGWLTPDGWPERGDAWINSGTMYSRVKFGRDVGEGSIPLARPTQWRGWSALSQRAIDEQIDGVVKDILAGVVRPETRNVLLSYQSDTASVPRLHALLATVLASPEFQRR